MKMSKNVTDVLVVLALVCMNLGFLFALFSGNAWIIPIMLIAWLVQFFCFLRKAEEMSLWSMRSTTPEEIEAANGLFAMTPRAGQWNHRFLIPKHSDCSERAISALIHKVTRSPIGQDHISASIEARQTTTGRIGTEIIVFQSPRLRRLDDHAKQQLASELNSRLGRLGEIVQNGIDWEDRGQDLFVKVAELDRWQEEVEAEVDALYAIYTAS